MQVVEKANGRGIEFAYMVYQYQVKEQAERVVYIKKLKDTVRRLIQGLCTREIPRCYNKYFGYDPSVETIRDKLDEVYRLLDQLETQQTKLLKQTIAKQLIQQLAEAAIIQALNQYNGEEP